MESKKIRDLMFSLIKRDIFQELLYTGIGCTFFLIFIPLLPKHYWDTKYRTTFILILILALFLTLLILNQVGSKIKIYKVNYNRNLILFTIFNFGYLYFLFFKTNFGINGVSGDNFYRSAYITQMVYSGYPQDFIYKDFSAFYAPFYWYCLALIAIVFQIKSYKMIRIGMLLTYYLLPILLYEFWKKIYKEKIAFIITIMSFFFFYDLYSIDHLISYLLFIPYIMYYFENYRAKTFNTKNYIFAGLIGSIIFCTYFLIFLIIPIYYLISLFQNKKKLKSQFNHLFKLTLSIMLFSSWFWLPLLRDILLIGFESHQQNYLTESMLKLPFHDYLSFSVGGAFLFSGLIFIVRKFNYSEDLKILGNIIIAVFIITLIGFIGILLNSPIMHLRFIKISTYALIVSSSIFYVRFFSFIPKTYNIRKLRISLNLEQIEIYLFILIMASQCYRIYMAIPTSSGYIAAKKEYVPDDLIDIFEELDYEDKVFLTNEWRVAAFIPIYLFLYRNPYYSHPSALYNERIRFLIELSECDSSKEFYDKIIDNKFGTIDYFFLDLEDNATKLVFEAAIEKFPDGRDYFDIVFDRALFTDDKYFKEIEIDGEIIYKTKY